MPINPDAVGSIGPPAETTWTSRDALIYALGIGAGTEELAFTTENSIGIDQRVFPTMAVVLARLDGAFGQIGKPPAWLVVLLAIAVATFAHIVLASRTARATVLIPAVALPLAGFGVSPASLIMVTAIGSGFCQTLMVSAKPVALFGGMEPPAFSPSDLLRLALMLALPFIALLALFALVIWPAVGLET